MSKSNDSIALNLAGEIVTNLGRSRDRIPVIAEIISAEYAPIVKALQNLVDAVDNDMTRKYPASFPGFVSAIGHARAAIAKAKGKV